MAVAIANVSAASSAVSATSYATASFTPVANDLYLAWIATRTSITTDPTQPTLTGAGLTWVAIASVVYDNTSSSRRRLTLFRALGASPASGAITFDEAGQTQTHASYGVDHVTGMDTTGTNGSGAIVQSNTNFDGSATASTLSVSLTATSASSAAYGVFGGNQVISSAGSGFSLLGNTSDGASNIGAGSEWEGAVSVTAVAATFGANEEMGGIAVEIKVPTAGVTATPGYFITYNPTFLS